MIGEEEAREWVRSRPYVDADAFGRIERLADLVQEENGRQNLIAPSTEPLLWSRHVVDSLQLFEFMGSGGRWLDVGSGGGFPGLVLAMLSDFDIMCVEPRRARAEFLSAVAHARPRASVVQSRIEHVKGEAFDVVTARAVAPPTKLIAMTLHLAHFGTRWALPSGSSAPAQLDLVRKDWHGVFHVKHSVTSEDAGIILVERLAGRRRT